MICALTSSVRSLWCTALTEAAVPTGIKMGVWITPWSVVSSPARALELGSVLVRLNFIVESLRSYEVEMELEKRGEQPAPWPPKGEWKSSRHWSLALGNQEKRSIVSDIGEEDE